MLNLCNLEDKPILQTAPELRFARYRRAIDKALKRVRSGQSYILGPQVETFEQAFAAYIGTKHCIGVNSGTDAIALALRAIGIGPGDEVITTALTAAGTAHAILQTGATLRFSDIDPRTRCLDPSAVAASLTPCTAAIVPVHLFGYPAPMTELCAVADRHGLVIVEDCAQAHGARIGSRRLGTFGIASAFSFYPTKNLGGLGDGGAVVTDDAGIAARVRALRCYGWTGPDKVSSELAFNSRLDEIQASILLALLPHLDSGNDERRAVAARYRDGLADTGAELPLHDEGCVYHQFAIAFDGRDGLARILQEEYRIHTAVHYWPALHRQPAFCEAREAKLAVTERTAARVLSLPIQPELIEDKIDRIIDAVRTGLARSGPDRS